jgi:hypothetical protein
MTIIKPQTKYYLKDLVPGVTLYREFGVLYRKAKLDPMCKNLNIILFSLVQNPNDEPPVNSFASWSGTVVSLEDLEQNWYECQS